MFSLEEESVTPGGAEIEFSEAQQVEAAAALAAAEALQNQEEIPEKQVEQDSEKSKHPLAELVSN